MGAGIVEMFANSPQTNLFGVMTGTVLGTQFPDEPALMVRFKADPDNGGPVFIGDSSINCVWQLNAGSETEWNAAPNLNKFFCRAVSGTMDYIQWWLQR